MNIVNIIFVHGLESSGQGFKGQLLRKILPRILTPDFFPFSPNISYDDLLDKRMKELTSILKKETKWVLIGSSFGGLMSAIFACKYPTKVAKMILLAPALVHSKLEPGIYPVLNIPVIIFHGNKDTIVPLESARERAKNCSQILRIMWWMMITFLSKLFKLWIGRN